MSVGWSDYHHLPWFLQSPEKIIFVENKMVNKLNQIALPIALIIVVLWIVMTYRKEKMQEKKEKIVETVLKFKKRKT
jgi:hypothetical protein